MTPTARPGVAHLRRHPTGYPMASPAAACTRPQPAIPMRVQACGQMHGRRLARTWKPIARRWSPLRPGMESAGLPTQVNEGALQSPLDDLRAESEVIRRQVGALREVVARLRDAAQKMEGERAELRTFLDGSDSALARLEAWVGKQMGLNLEQSADSARRYLPLSVVWVIAMRLKNLVALLYDSSRTLTVSQEQMDETLGELQSAVEAASRFSGAMTQVAGGPQNGFSATVAQFAWQPAPANSAEALSPGARAELERSVREELRRSLEDSVRDEIAALVRREEEQRLAPRDRDPGAPPVLE